jgi:serine protease inhibitor ecotin
MNDIPVRRTPSAQVRPVLRLTRSAILLLACATASTLACAQGRPLRLIVPFPALKQFRVRDVICPDDGDTTYVTAALIFDTEQPRESRCIYVWNRETLESAWKHFQAEVERMTDAPKLAQ